MDKFVRLTAVACPLAVANIDTDQLLPARYLKVPRSAGLGGMLMHDLRRNADGSLRGDFPLNQPVWREAKIIVGGANFGGGSSREAAVYALYDAGIRCVIAPSFGDIFAQNCVKNGLLPVVLPESTVHELAATLNSRPGLKLTVDLENQTITCGNRIYRFEIDSSRRAQLLNGWDDVDLTKSHESEIAAFKVAHHRRFPWVFGASAATGNKNSSKT